ncbi:MAG: MarR family transcriptional regulator [Salinarimonadaceae bacterium]|nr:MAG: MarR family transcriptional regulator [Salinarimonadaceae bacterium]
MSASRPAPAVATASPRESDAPARLAPAYDLIELFFFAYRDFVSDPDRILVEYGFGRAHHRVLHFVARQPGLTIAELLDVLKITKQSLNRVLKELIEKGFVESRMGTTDRRQRLLHATPQGCDLALRLAEIQSTRIARAIEGAASGVDAQAMRDCVTRFLLRMVDEEERAVVHALASTPPRRNDSSATGE